MFRFLTDPVETVTFVERINNAVTTVSDWLGTSVGLASALMGATATLIVAGVVVLIKKQSKKAKRGYYR